MLGQEASREFTAVLPGFGASGALLCIWLGLLFFWALLLTVLLTDCFTAGQLAVLCVALQHSSGFDVMLLEFSAGFL